MKKLKNLFNSKSKTDHLSRSVVGAIFVFAATNSAPAFFASIVIFHLISSGVEAYKVMRKENSVKP